jgi:cytochrome P450
MCGLCTARRSRRLSAQQSCCKAQAAVDPDRFSAANSKSRDRWQYLPFGAGPRSCIGDHFAMREATLAPATIVRRTEIHSLRKQHAAGS